MRYNILLFVFILLGGWVSSANCQNAQTTNVKYTLDQDGAITITYDFVDTKGKYVVSAEILSEGVTYRMDYAKGDIGDRVVGGKNKKIVWDINRQFPEGLIITDIYVKASKNYKKDIAPPLFFLKGGVGVGLPIIEGNISTAIFDEDSAKVAIPFTVGIGVNWSSIETGIYYVRRGHSYFYEFEGVAGSDQVDRTEVYNHSYSGIEIPLSISMPLGKRFKVKPGAYYFTKISSTTSVYRLDEISSGGTTTVQDSWQEFSDGERDFISNNDFGALLGLEITGEKIDSGLDFRYGLSNLHEDDLLPTWLENRSDRWNDFSVQLFLKFKFL